MTIPVSAFAPDTARGRWRALALLSVAELLGMSVWFAGTAVAKEMLAHLGTTAGPGWLTTVVQLGFVAGTALAAMLNLADILPGRWYFAGSAMLAALANGALLVVPNYPLALACRFVTGAALAGVYPPAMKMISTWFRARRGLAVGTVVGALTIGKATPYLVHAFPHADWRVVVMAASAGATLAAILVGALHRDGPYPFPPRPFSWSLVRTVVGSREWRLASGGYFGHMFELYSFWTWIPVFLAANAAAMGLDPRWVNVGAFGTIAVGGVGCVWGGLVADRVGRERLVTIAMAVSGGCAILAGAAFGRSPLLIGVIALLWGFFVIADSAQFSVLVTESVPPHAVGTALTLQTSLGFLLTTVSIELVPPVQHVVGWHWAFAMLALGPLFGIASVRALATRHARAARRAA